MRLTCYLWNSTNISKSQCFRVAFPLTHGNTINWLFLSKYQIAWNNVASFKDISRIWNIYCFNGQNPTFIIAQSWTKGNRVQRVVDIWFISVCKWNKFRKLLILIHKNNRRFSENCVINYKFISLDKKGSKLVQGFK